MNCLFNYGFKEAFLATLLRFLNVTWSAGRAEAPTWGRCSLFTITARPGLGLADRQRAVSATQASMQVWYAFRS